MAFFNVAYFATAASGSRRTIDLNLGMTPTWTGVHTFSSGIRQGTMTAGRYLRSDGTNFVSAVIAAGDLPANGANPSASVGLSAVNGSATTWMRSDAAPALSQSITPTWTGAHTWSNTALSLTGSTISVGNYGGAAQSVMAIQPAISGAGCIIGMLAFPTFTNSETVTYGMFLQATSTPGASTTLVVAAQARISPQPGVGKTISVASALDVDAISAGAGACTTLYIARINGAAGTLVPTVVVGLHIANQTLGTNNYDLGFGVNDATALGAYVGRVPVLYGGVKRYMPVYA